MSDDQSQNSSRLSAAEMQSRAIQGSSWTVIHTAISVPIAFVANALIARSLGVVGYGDLAFLTTAITLGYVIANFGFNTALIQAGTRAEATGRRAEADALLRRCLGFRALVELPILVAIAFALTQGDPRWQRATVGTAVVATSLLGGALLSLTIENRTSVGARLAIPVNMVLQAASVVTAFATASASAVWAVRTVVPALAVALGLPFVNRVRRRAVLRPQLPRGLGRRFWSYALTSWAAGLIGMLVFSRSEIFLLKGFDQTEALGLFALAFGLSYQITAPVDAMLLALTPAVAGILSAWPERAARTFERSTRVSALLSGGVAAIIVPSVASAIPIIYGDDFREVVWLFVPLAFVSVFQSANNPVIAFVNGRQRGGLILKANSGALVLNLALGVMFIPLFGAWGAVGANVAGQLAALLALALTEPLVVERGVRGVLRLFRPYFFGVAAGAVALVVGVSLQDSSAGLALIVSCGVGTALYVTAVRLLRFGLTPDDRDALVGAVAARAGRSLSLLLRPVTTRE